MNKVIYCIGIGTLISSTIMLYVTFLFAYFSDYSVIVYVNRYNEAHIEFIMLLIFIPIAVYTGFKAIKDEKKRMDNINNSSK